MLVLAYHLDADTMRKKKKRKKETKKRHIRRDSGERPGWKETIPPRDGYAD